MPPPSLEPYRLRTTNRVERLSALLQEQRKQWTAGHRHLAKTAHWLWRQVHQS